ncbi:MAG: YihY/virulence factor BrkB family protein [Rhodothermales bacterium]
MTLKAIGGMLGETVTRFVGDSAPRLGAALAYYTVISLAPLLLVFVGVMGQVLGREAARGEIVGQVEGAIGPEAAELVQQAIEAAGRDNSGLIATVLGVVALFLGATTVFVNLNGSLNTIWGVEPVPGQGGLLRQVRTFFVNRLTTFAALLGIGFLLVVSLGVSAAIEAAAAFFADRLPVPPGTLRLVNLVVSVGVITLLFAYIYRAIPDVRIAWRDVFTGAFFTAVLFTLGKYLIGLYLGRSSVGSAYGAAGALVVLLVWIYYSALIFFLGAEFTQVYARHRGKPFEPAPGFRAVGAAAPSEAGETENNRTRDPDTE